MENEGGAKSLGQYREDMASGIHVKKSKYHARLMNREIGFLFILPIHFVSTNGKMLAPL